MLMKILDEARIGELSNNSSATLKWQSIIPAAAFGASGNDNDCAKDIIPTLLKYRNRDVDKTNYHKIAKLTGEIHTFKSQDRAMTDTMRAQLKTCQAPTRLDLKISAQLILLKNINV